jgi:DNA-binding MarR family transcriptional regulator
MASDDSDTTALDDQVEAAMSASRVFVGVIAASMAEVEATVSPLQFRTMVIVGAWGPLNVTALAERLGIHPSNATRVCDRLVRGGLLERTQSDLDRRHLELTLTPDGRRLVGGVMERRRVALTRVLSEMTPRHRLTLTRALQAFGDAAGEGVGTDPSQYDLSLAVQ